MRMFVHTRLGGVQVPLLCAYTAFCDSRSTHESMYREWMRSNDARAQEFSQHAHYIEPHPTKAALGHSRHAGSDSCNGSSAHKTAVQNFKLSKFVNSAKHKVDDSEPGVMDTIRPVRDVRINGQTQAALVI